MIKFPGCKWLPDGPYDFEIDTVARLFEFYRGYQNCGLDDSLESGFLKVAIYEDPNDKEEPFSHVAVQLPDGRWTSKLGPDEDIEHNTLAALEGDTSRYRWSYGRVARIMKRPIR